MAANEWNDGYVTDIDYTYGHYREMVPAMIQFSLLCAGKLPPEPVSFNYCELGFGQGVGLNLMAATHPEAQFYGTDFNPAQAVGAKRIAEQAELANIHLFNVSFEAMRARVDLPEFDYIALHGVYSWVSPANRRHLVDFIGEKLKPGGALYISCNTLPGWAPTLPVRGLMNQYYDVQTPPGQPIPQRVNDSVAFIKKLAALPQGYLKGLPLVAEQIDKLSQQNANYVAHEYFNRDWHPMFFTDIAAELSQAKVKFGASADVGNLVNAINFAPESTSIFAGVSDPVFREQLRDFVLNARFRRDIFIKGAQPVGQNVQAARLKAIRIGLIRPRVQCKLEVTTAIGTLGLKEGVYLPILDALASGPLTIEEISSLPAVSKLRFSQLLQALVILVATNYAQPCGAEQPSARAQVAARKLNHLFADFAREPGMPDINYLAAPALGGGLPQARFGRLFADWVASGGEPAAEVLAEQVWQLLSSLGQTIVKNGERLATSDENRAELREQATSWIGEQLPILRQLGAV